MSLFPGGIGSTPRADLGVLYRLETAHHNLRLLVQSLQEPDTSNLPVGYTDAGAVPLGPLLERSVPGTTVRYRIVANATKRFARGAQHLAGKRIALGADDTRLWWATQATVAGLALLDDPTLQSDTITGRDPTDGRITLRPWRIDGSARVTDSNALADAIAAGIGKGRAFGCGLLTIAHT